MPTMSTYDKAKYETIDSSSTFSSKEASNETKSGPRLIDVKQVDRMFPVATKAAAFAWFFLVLLVYSIVPPEQYVYLEGAEREAAAAACYVFLVTTGLSVIPLYVSHQDARQSSKEKREISGIVWAAIFVQTIATITNGMLAWLPTVVVEDPVTHARVYLIRWCEWIPLAGLMTFFSEIVDCEDGIYGVLPPVLIALSQSFSCLLAMLFPFCPSVASWSLFCCLSVMLYLTIFPRLWGKYKTYKSTKQGLTLPEMEHHCRTKFGFQLLLTCSIVWSILVVFFFANMLAFRYFPSTHFVRNEALPMILDTLFDVTAKALYMKLIVDVHTKIFDADGRARRQLSELKRMINVLWESSSDVIVISVRNGRSITTMISPTFPCMMGATVALEGQTRAAMVIKSEEMPVAVEEDLQSKRRMEEKDDKDNMPSSSKAGATAIGKKKFQHVHQIGSVRLKSSAYFVDAAEIPYGMNETKHNLHLPSIEMDDFIIDQVESIISAAWNHVANDEQTPGNISTNKSDVVGTVAGKEALVVLDMQKLDGSALKGEIKVSKHSSNAVIAIVRDVTERYLRFDAEKRHHVEALARQRDAQSVNRFTRHEIKNGLLAGIEMCQEVTKRVDTMKVSALSGSNKTGGLINIIEQYDPTKCLADLDSALHEILDTVLAEAMAREVVHESYQPKLERVDVYEALSSSGLGINDENGRFLIQVCPSDMPFLSMDPQLLKYIHRNAVSNACKYGREGGRIVTEVHYFERQGEFEMDVINEPGPHHDKLMAMGRRASDAVFSQATRLDVHKTHEDDTHQISSGDGAWIMQKCAKTLGGACRIRFDSHQTIFSFRCKAGIYTRPWKSNEEFQVPPNTWGVAFDDTAIQRRLMTRTLMYAGVDESRVIVRGKYSNDIHEFHKLLLKLLSYDDTSRILVLMDENLDYDYEGANHRYSGSKFSAKALASLTKEHLARVFVLVRSANDSDSDIALYKERTHGFFPKASMRKERIRELLAPRWYERFPELAAANDTATTDTATVEEWDVDAGGETEEDVSLLDNHKRDSLSRARQSQRRSINSITIKDFGNQCISGGNNIRKFVSPSNGSFDHGIINSNIHIMKQGERLSSPNDPSKSENDLSKSDTTLVQPKRRFPDDGINESDEILKTVKKVDTIIKSSEDTDWQTVWRKMHVLKGDLMAVENNEKIERCVMRISGLRGDARPPILNEEWNAIRTILYEEILS